MNPKKNPSLPILIPYQHYIIDAVKFLMVGLKTNDIPLLERVYLYLCSEIFASYPITHSQLLIFWNLHNFANIKLDGKTITAEIPKVFKIATKGLRIF